MYPFYETTEREIWVMDKESRHVRPHLHHALEFVYVTEGTLELGVGKELYHMEKGDLGVVFPDMIHHYQVFSKGKNTGCYLLAKPTVCSVFGTKLLHYCPKFPIISREQLPDEIIKAIEALRKSKEEDVVLRQAYIQIILAKSLPCLSLLEKNTQGDGDFVYEVVVYMATHFKEHILLPQVARDLGVSKYKLSRIFSGTFHTNFNQYLNEIRLSYVCELLEYTEDAITDICLEAGFESQRTFNRVFREQYRMTPREYRRSRRVRGFCLL